MEDRNVICSLTCDRDGSHDGCVRGAPRVPGSHGLQLGGVARGPGTPTAITPRRGGSQSTSMAFWSSWRGEGGNCSSNVEASTRSAALFPWKTEGHFSASQSMRPVLLLHPSACRRWMAVLMKGPVCVLFVCRNTLLSFSFTNAFCTLPWSQQRFI